MPESSATRKYQAVIGCAPIGVAILDRELRYEYVNDHLAAINGVSAAESIGRSIGQVMGQLADAIVPSLRELVRTGQPTTIPCGGVLSGDPSGRVRHFDAHYRALRDERGAVTGVAAYVLEITAQVAAEEERSRMLAVLDARNRSELEHSRVQLEQAQAIALLGSWEANMATGEVVWSRELRRMYGVDADYPASYASWLDLLHPEDRAHVIAEVDRSIATGEPIDYECRLVRPGGEVRVIAGRNRAIGSVDGRPVRLFGTVQDITDRKAMEARLMVTDRMSSLGTLAAGLAHEINNPLAYTLGNVDLVLESLDALAEEVAELPSGGAVRGRLAERIAAQRELLALVAEGGRRVSAIVRDVKIFARGGAEEDGEIDLRAVVESAVTLASNEIRHRARLTVANGPAPRVHGNAARLGQVLLNLLVNATQAIPEGKPDDNEIRVGTFCDAEGRAVFEVVDTGSGIAPEHLSRIFDPFFTTKPVGQGSGLGLSICHGIVQSFGGAIEVESEPGRGTRVRVSLPAAVPSQPVAPPPPPPPSRPRVLVVDDEPQVVALAKRCLAKSCDVLGMTDAREALARITEGEDFALVLCDVMMPRMGGVEFFERVAADHPALAERFVFISGGAFTPRAQEFMERETRVRLDKPFTPAQLRALVDSRLQPQHEATSATPDTPATDP